MPGNPQPPVRLLTNEPAAHRVVDPPIAVGRERMRLTSGSVRLYAAAVPLRGLVAFHLASDGHHANAMMST
jgi:hypothetical protein